MRTAGAILNLVLAGVFALMAVLWFRRGETGWAAFGGLASAVNVVLAVVKFGGRREGGGNP